MTTLLDLGVCIVALEHIVKAEYTSGRKGGEPYFDEDQNAMMTTTARQARMDLTLTSVHLATDELGYSDPLLVGGSASDHILLHGEIAEKLAIWMQSRAEIVILASVED
jgi:hypothetical protein